MSILAKLKKLFTAPSKDDVVEIEVPQNQTQQTYIDAIREMETEAEVTIVPPIPEKPKKKKPAAKKKKPKSLN